MLADGGVDLGLSERGANLLDPGGGVLLHPELVHGVQGSPSAAQARGEVSRVRGLPGAQIPDALRVAQPSTSREILPMLEEEEELVDGRGRIPKEDHHLR